MQEAEKKRLRIAPDLSTEESGRSQEHYREYWRWGGGGRKMWTGQFVAPEGSSAGAADCWSGPSDAGGKWKASVGLAGWGEVETRAGHGTIVLGMAVPGGIVWQSFYHLWGVPGSTNKESFHTERSQDLMVREDSMNSFFLPSKLLHSHTSKCTFIILSQLC